MHSTDNMDDGYLGSGKRLRYSIGKYGKDNHTIEILEYCESRGKLANREEEIVNLELIDESMCMNLVVGGTGGFEHINNDPKLRRLAAVRRKSSIAKLRETDRVWVTKRSNAISQGLISSYKSGRRFPNSHDWTGKKHTEATKIRMSNSQRGKHEGSDNSQYGTMWIYSMIEEKSKKIKRSDIVPDGWQLGMVTDFAKLHEKNIKLAKKQDERIRQQETKLNDNIKEANRLIELYDNSHYTSLRGFYSFIYGTGDYNYGYRAFLKFISTYLPDLYSRRFARPLSN